MHLCVTSRYTCSRVCVCLCVCFGTHGRDGCSSRQPPASISSPHVFGICSGRTRRLAAGKPRSNDSPSWSGHAAAAAAAVVVVLLSLESPCALLTGRNVEKRSRTQHDDGRHADDPAAVVDHYKWVCYDTFSLTTRYQVRSG